MPALRPTRDHPPRPLRLSKGGHSPRTASERSRAGTRAAAEAIDSVLDHVVAKDYRVEERLTLDIAVHQNGRVIDPASQTDREPMFTAILRERNGQ